MILAIFYDSGFIINDCTTFIFVIIVSTSKCFIWSPEYWWFPYRSTNGRVLLYHIDNIAEAEYCLCITSKLLEFNEAHMRRYIILAFILVFKYTEEIYLFKWFIYSTWAALLISFILCCNWWLGVSSGEDWVLKYVNDFFGDKRDNCFASPLRIEAMVMFLLLRLLFILRIPSLLKSHSMMHATYFDSSSFPLDVNKKCSHIWAARYNFCMMWIIFFAIQSFAYCLVSSKNYVICLLIVIIFDG